MADGYWYSRPMMPASKGPLRSEPHAPPENRYQGSLDTYRSGVSAKVNALSFTVFMLRYALTLGRMRTRLGSLIIGGTSDISPVRTPGHAALGQSVASARKERLTPNGAWFKTALQNCVIAALDSPYVLIAANEVWLGDSNVFSCRKHHRLATTVIKCRAFASEPSSGHGSAIRASASTNFMKVNIDVQTTCSVPFCPRHCLISINAQRRHQDSSTTGVYVRDSEIRQSG